MRTFYDVILLRARFPRRLLAFIESNFILGSLGICAAQRETKKSAFAFFVSCIVLAVATYGISLPLLAHLHRLIAAICLFATYGVVSAYGGVWWIFDLVVAGIVAFLAWKYGSLIFWRYFVK